MIPWVALKGVMWEVIFQADLSNYARTVWPRETTFGNVTYEMDIFFGVSHAASEWAVPKLFWDLRCARTHRHSMRNRDQILCCDQSRHEEIFLQVWPCFMLWQNFLVTQMLFVVANFLDHILYSWPRSPVHSVGGGCVTILEKCCLLSVPVLWRYCDVCCICVCSIIWKQYTDLLLLLQHPSCRQLLVIS